MEKRRDPRILTIPPGIPFLRELAQSLLDGRLTPDFRYEPDDPLSLSRVTIFLPTRRAVRVMRSEFVDLLGGRSAILPVIKPLGETEEDESYFDADLPALFDLAPPISNTARLIELARLILAWRNQLPDIVRSIHTDTPLVAPASPADAVWLARALVELIDAVETEERDWEDLAKLDAGNYASWWQLTLEFLRIASAFWPERLRELNRSSPSRHRNAMLRAEAQRIASLSGNGPVIVAGSTGSIPAAADFISAVANLPEGVVVLPGLDQSMPPEHWLLAGAEDGDMLSSDPASRSHPQYGLFHLLKRLQYVRADVEALATSPDDLKDRAEVLSRTMAPAAATDDWTVWRQGFSASRLEAAFADVSLIEAANEREEACAIAIALRLALEEPGISGESRAALITPDRELAKRVKAELARFGITADDSAGTPLSASPQGTLLMLLLEAALRPGDPVVIVSLLKHPLVRFGMNEQDCQSAAMALELIALRGGLGVVDIDGLEALLETQLKSQEGDRHTPQWRLSLPEGAAESARRLAQAIQRAAEPLTTALMRRNADGRFSSRLAMREWAERTGKALEAACADARGDLAILWSGEAGEALAGLFGQIIETDGVIEADGPQWADIMNAFMAGEAVKPRAMRHPRVYIFGSLEARLQSVDTMILGGLNEGSWPNQTTNNPFLSRMMKTGIGLEPPERRIGQLAHDFEMANGTRRLIYSRAMRQGSAPTVASRWLQRLMALGGPDFAKSLRERGEIYRHYAGLIDLGERQEPAQRPAPKPAADLQPKRYSFSEVGRLRRDPYSIYARRILKLDPLDDFNKDPGAAERGTLYHRIVEQFVREGHSLDPLVADAAMDAIIQREFAAEHLPPHIEVVWLQRFRDVGRAFLAWERGRRGEIQQSFTEVPAGMEIAEAGIRLTGIADRIDLKGAGHADIIDYKTGLNPSPQQARTLVDPQLALEAAALAEGAFKKVGAQRTDNLVYVRLRPGDRFKVDQVNNELTGRGDDTKSAADLAHESIGQLIRFVKLLQSGERGYVSRLMPFMESDLGGEYDHLARVAEWSTAEAEEGAGDE